MIFLRYLFSILLFVAGVVFFVQCLLAGFDWILFAFSLVCFLLAYWIKPKRKNHHRDNAWDWLDLIDFPVEIIYWIITLPFRLLRGIFDFLSPDIP
ncbi:MULTISPECIES: hypothetical protein [unclassified Acinetobacter]|uniref:hypothetical protein n=1 Tax=unclassified Acinetobacter TaxID=196816 RepID=UPI002449A198|nr:MULTISPECIES: hypothetical protein [unclassified Acinetobacter]MDH0031941.1 hypothetical protein [Acinetobacter sp. GD04021]MDH0887350.1 hypothetical protein [Acinetobacter sp. GD03873]MDH1083945.1 hypothetical protein [Acinetobacter sp. GD03983]MDH2190666.1 hypothetical protein [Acinetobacter sp. GD03645]MDH2202156.1 hypothetical protein [Acinetobacter sp. GD03647]